MASNLAVFNQKIRDQRTQDYLNDVLKEKKDSFVTSLVSVVTNNTALQACEPLTIMYAALKATALSLPIDPNLGLAYVIPYKNKGTDEAQFQIGYKGIIQLAQRSGQYAFINADAVREGELTKRDKLTGSIELDGEATSDKVIGYFAHFELLNGFKKTLYMTIDEIRKHANRFSQTAKRGYGLWADKDAFDAMAKKTVLKMLLSRYGLLSIEMQTAMTADQAIYRDASMTENYADNMEADTKTEAAEKIRAKADAVKARIKATATQPQYQDEIPVEEPEVPEETVFEPEFPADESFNA